MEIVSAHTVHNLVFFASVFTTIVLLGRLVLRWIDRKVASPPDDLLSSRDLADPSVRADLTAFLTKRRVVGNADIRDGFVFAPVPVERLDPLATVLSNAAGFTRLLTNPAACIVYVRDSMTGKEYPLGDLDLDNIGEAARVMQRVAEDRRKSRSLYKGLTEDEMRAMVRAGLSQWLKDAGDFPESNEVMQGLWDERPEFLMALNVLELLYKVKGARND